MTDIVNRLQGVILNVEREISLIYASINEIQRLRKLNQVLQEQLPTATRIGTLWQHDETGRTLVVMLGDPQPGEPAGAAWHRVGPVHVTSERATPPAPGAEGSHS